MIKGGVALSEASVQLIIDFSDIYFLNVARVLLLGRPAPFAWPGMSRSLRSDRHKRLVELLITSREEAGLKQSEVAEKLGRQQPFISNIENGQRRVDVIELLELAEAIGFDPKAVIEKLLK